jgi:hypothetical protein
VLRSTDAMLLSLGSLVVLLPLDDCDFRPVLAHDWHGPWPLDANHRLA